MLTKLTIGDITEAVSTSMPMTGEPGSFDATSAGRWYRADHWEAH